ncbi:MAG: glycosyltransferase family 2 protein [Fodinibius sp.]|nr:glycosyltransferase family 2 protein [Fodinibius sp.]
MAESPKVTVIIPHYEMQQTLPAAVKSVLHQEYNNIELIVADDGSEESVTDTLAPFADNLTLLELPHNGKPTAVNEALGQAGGTYITILDADDQLPPNSISTRVKAVAAEDVDLAVGSFDVYYKGQHQSTRSMGQFQAYANQQIIRRLLTDLIAPFHQNAMLFSRSLAERVGRMDPLMLRSQDKDFAVRLLHHSSNTAIVDETVYHYHRYDRPFSRRLSNRLAGMYYKLQVIDRHTSGWQRVHYWGQNIAIEMGKFVHDIFGIYKK